MIRRALLSVSDKTGLVELAAALVQMGVELISTGGTARVLRDAGLPVKEVSDLTGFPELIGGRVKTLHPAIHGAILSRRTPEDDAELAAHSITPIDLVVANLYPFRQAVARPGCTLDDAVEEIDIGGVTLLRASAKNHAHVAVVSDPADYPGIMAELRSYSGELAAATRARLAVAAFAHTAAYDAAIASYLSKQTCAGASTFPATLVVAAEKAADLRYGENPHQRAALYVTTSGGVAGGRLLQGKQLSYNNLLDLDAAWGAVRSLEAPAAVIVKHNTPCGAARAATLAAAYELAHQGDPLSAFGGVLACSSPLDAATASAIGKRFLECIAAPDFEPEALAILAAKPDCRLLALEPSADSPVAWRPIDGGILVQERDVGDLTRWEVVTRRAPTETEAAGLRFAWAMARHVKSNAITLARGQALVGVGGGQTSRVDAVHMAVRKAADRAAGAVLASDAFFPFRDGIDLAAAAGVTAIIQPGGSLRDAESVAAADEAGIAMVLTGMRHFRH